MSKEVKKRRYSRNGCIQCKKRKFKCDEHKPSCYNCINSNKECSYRQILKFKDSRSFTIKGSTLSSVGELKNDRKDPHEPSKPAVTSVSTEGATDSLRTVTKHTTIPVTKPSVDPFLDALPQVVQNPLTPTQPNAKQSQQTGHIENTTASPDSAQQAPSKPTLGMDAFPTNFQSPMLPMTPSGNNISMMSQIDLENSLFSGATNLITDLNGLINSLEIDFNTLDFQTSMNPQPSNCEKASSRPISNINKLSSSAMPMANYQQNSQPFTPSLSSIRFEGISPTNYSIASSDSHAAEPGLSPTLDNQNLQYQPPYSSNSSYFPNNKNSAAFETEKKLSGDPQSIFIPSEKHSTLSLKRKFEEDTTQNDIEKNNTLYNSKSGSKDNKDIGEEEEDDDDYNDNDEEDQAETSNNNYIQTLTRSLVDYGSPKVLSNIKSPANDYYLSSNYGTSRSYFKRFIDENSKAFPHPNIQSLIPFDYIEMLNKTISNEDIELLASFFNWGLNSSHVKYLKIFVTHIHLNIIPFSTNYAHNAYLRIFLQQAEHSPHLLFAILAISARFEVYQIEQRSNLPNYEEKLNYHRTFRTYYLSSCLRSLESVLHSKQTTLNNIESLLLTIQVLASDFSGHKGSQWRTHLHGAKDLLVKYCRYRPLSLELTIVWLWFYSMEVLAALTTPHGGTIHNFDELDEFLPVLCPQTPEYLNYLRQNTDLYNNHVNDLIEPGKLTNALVHFGIVIDGKLEFDIPSRFNMYLGYDETILEVFNALVYAIECIRSKDSDSRCKKFEIYERKILDSQGKSLNSSFLLSLFALIKKARTFNYINNEPPYIVPLGKGVHPSEIIQKAFEEKDSIPNPILEKVYISAFIHPTQISGNNSNETKKTEDDSVPSTSSGKSFSDLDSKSSTPILGDELSNKLNASQKQSSVNALRSVSPDVTPIKEKEKEKEKEVETEKEKERDKEKETYRNIEREIYFSWVDLSQQLNADAAFLRLLTLHGGISAFGLGIKSPLVQDVVSRMIVGLYSLVRFREETAEEIDYNGKDDMLSLNTRYEGVESATDSEERKETGLDSVKELSNWPAFPFEKFLIYQFDNRLVMVQWPLYVCGLCCIEPRHKAVIECCFSGLIDLGVGSGELSLKKLRKIWTLQKLGQFDFEKFNLFGQGFDDDEEDDYVPFM